MKHYQPINIFAHASPEVIPSMTAQRVQFSCYHCGQTTLIPVPQTYCDWECVAKDYQRHLQRVVTEMGQAIKEIELIHGMENPVTQFYRNKWAMLMLEIQAHYGTAPKGTSAHQRDDGEDQKEGWKHLG